MATIAINDVTFTEPNKRNAFEVLDSSTNDFKLYRYPEDLGAADKGHYMIFFIREQKDTNFSAKNRDAQTFSDKETISQKLAQGNPEAGTFITDKSPFAQLNRTVLTNESIVLYMPDTLNFDSRQSYNTLQPGTELLGQALAVGPELLSKFKAGDFKGMAGSAIKSGVGMMAATKLASMVPILSSSPKTVELGLFAQFGQVINPMLEMLYVSPEPRNFQFEFMFYPRSESEAQQVLQIIELFRFHAAPELGGTGMLIPPSEFDMKFFYRGKENPNIPPIGTCVLKDVQTNYAPKGFATYESLSDTPTKGGTGMPVAITMSLAFTETTYLTKEDFSFNKNSIPMQVPMQPAAASQKLITAQDFAGNGRNTPTQKTKKRNKKPIVKQGNNTDTGVKPGIDAGNKKNKVREDNRYLTKYGLTAPDLGGGAGG
jgi:hypothetical protein